MLGASGARVKRKAVARIGRTKVRWFSARLAFCAAEGPCIADVKNENIVRSDENDDLLSLRVRATS